MAQTHVLGVYEILILIQLLSREDYYYHYCCYGFYSWYDHMPVKIMLEGLSIGTFLKASSKAESLGLDPKP